jgi:hypothetical protein
MNLVTSQRRESNQPRPKDRWLTAVMAGRCFEVIFSIYPELLCETRNNLNQRCRRPGRELSSAPPKCGADVKMALRVSVPGRDKKFSSSPYRPDRLWGPPMLLCNGYENHFHGGKAAGAWSSSLTSKAKKGGTILALPHTSSWRGAWLINRRDNCAFTFTLFLQGVLVFMHAHVEFLRIEFVATYSSVTCDSHFHSYIVITCETI